MRCICGIEILQINVYCASIHLFRSGVGPNDDGVLRRVHQLRFFLLVRQRQLGQSWGP